MISKYYQLTFDSNSNIQTFKYSVAGSFLMEKQIMDIVFLMFSVKQEASSQAGHVIIFMPFI